MLAKNYFTKWWAFKKRNQVHGYAIVAKWDDVLGIVTQNNRLTHQLKALIVAYEGQHESNEKQ